MIQFAICVVASVSRAERGYSLVEILVALALLGSFYAYGLQHAGEISASSVEATRRVQAHHLLMASLAMVLPSGGVPAGPDASGFRAANDLVASLLPGARLLFFQDCPRWRGHGCLAITWSEGQADACIFERDDQHQSRELRCIAKPW